jgi:hypothetical protein
VHTYVCHTDGSKLDGKGGFGYIITHRLHKVKQGSVGSSLPS